MVVQTKNSTSSSEHGEPTESSSQSSKMEAAALLSSLKKRQKSSAPNGFDSLEILRRNVQYFFNSEINNFIKDFVEKFFQPAIKNIKENTDETISENQIQEICKNLLENCAKTQFSNSISYQSDSSRNTIENETSDSDTSSSDMGQSLLHRALKRKRTDSENEMILKRQFFITAAKPSFYNNQTSSLLTSALTSPPKTMNSRPVFHLITTNRNSLKSSHAELVSLLKSNNNNSPGTSNVKVEEGSEIKIKKEKDEC